MTNAWFLGGMHSVPQTENEVRSTVEPIREDTSTSEQTHSPDWNEFDSDESGELVGLSPRVAGSDTRDSEQSQPFWLERAGELHNPRIDKQVSSSGTAAKREEAGESGPGTMQYALGIEPVVREGASFGNTMFLSNELLAQDGAGEYMAPYAGDAWNNASQADLAAAASRQAYQSTLYQNFLAG
jgi:hypothetical protein